MEQDRKTRDTDAEPERYPSDRREFLRKSLHAGPILLTAVHDGGFRGASIGGTLWASGGTDWTHRRRWWHGPDPGRFQDVRPPDVSDFPEPPGRQRTRPAEDQWEWRHWRPEPGEGDKPEWDWGYLRPEDEAPEDTDPLETPHPQE